MKAWYTILHIYEDDFGCEERPENQEKQVLVVLQDESGLQQTVRQDDAWLYAREIREGDRVQWKNGRLEKGEKTMTARELQKNGMLYRLDQDLLESHLNAKRITRELNATLETENPRRKELVQELFASAGEGSYIEPPFHCDYGCNTRVGKNFYCSYDCAFLDCGQITIGDNVMLGPKVGLYAVNHPIDPTIRATGLEYGKPITIGDNVWIGGSAVVCPGVTIGSGVVIGAGSVVVHDIPDNCVAVGNPARVVRFVDETDKRYWEEELELYRSLCDE